MVSARPRRSARGRRGALRRRRRRILRRIRARTADVSLRPDVHARRRFPRGLGVRPGGFSGRRSVRIRVSSSPAGGAFRRVRVAPSGHSRAAAAAGGASPFGQAAQGGNAFGQAAAASAGGFGAAAQGASPLDRRRRARVRLDRRRRARVRLDRRRRARVRSDRRRAGASAGAGSAPPRVSSSRTRRAPRSRRCDGRRETDENRAGGRGSSVDRRERRPSDDRHPIQGARRTTAASPPASGCGRETFFYRFDESRTDARLHHSSSSTPRRFPRPRARYPSVVYIQSRPGGKLVYFPSRCGRAVLLAARRFARAKASWRTRPTAARSSS